MRDAQQLRAERHSTTGNMSAVPRAVHHPTVPFRNFVVKIHGRCNLDCDYCYMYRAADQRWRTEPRTMTTAVIDLVARRVVEHANAHRLTGVGIDLHGGEPLLAGPAAIERLLGAVRRGLGPRVRAEATLQTNGVRLTPRCLDVLAALDVGIGISLDGDRTAHDRHRRHHDGRGSHAEVSAGLRLLTQGPHRELFAGLLCTIDLLNEPVATYLHLAQYRPPTMDFLLPHANWSSPPPGREGGPAQSTPYADWLIRIFDHWYGAPVRQPGIRLFDQLISLLLGGPGRVEGVGLAPADYIVIETSGAITLDDALRTTYSGAVDTGLHVARNRFDDALRLPGVLARQSGAAALAPVCRGCGLRDVCGGGHYAHRYRDDGSGFANPSVYCADLQALIHHVRARLVEDVRRLAGSARGREAEPVRAFPDAGGTVAAAQGRTATDGAGAA